MRRHILLLTLSAAAALIGCANTTRPSAPPTASFVVVSMLGENLRLKQVGVTVFGNAEKKIDVTSWNVDGHSQATAAKALAATGRTVRATPADAGDEIGPFTFINFTSTYIFRGGTAALKRVANQANADFILLLIKTPSGYTDPFFHTNQSTAGYGVYQRRGGGAVAFADLVLVLIDAKTGEIVDRRRSFSSVERSDALWIDIEHNEPTLSDLGQPPEVFQGVIDSGVMQGIRYLGLL